MFTDISVFVGARSNVNESGWFWSNRTIIVDQSYPVSDQSICQQISWPLTYDDGINLRGKRCEDEAYFLCQTKCNLFMSFILFVLLQTKITV